MSGPSAARTDPPSLAAPATTTTAPPAVISPVLPPTTTRPGAGASTTAPAGGTAGGASVAGAAPLTPAPPGIYRYDTAGQSRIGALTAPFPAVTTLLVDPPAGSTQHATRDLRDAARNGPVFESVFDYRADGVYLVSLKVTTTLLLFTQSAELRPPAPVLFLPAGARPGLHRELDVPAQGVTAHLVLDVVRDERVTVGGQGVDTLVVRLTASLPGQANGQLDLTVWLAPANRLWVKERFVADATSPDGSIQYHSEYDATLQRLSPG